MLARIQGPPFHGWREIQQQEECSSSERFEAVCFGMNSWGWGRAETSDTWPDSPEKIINKVTDSH
jgi:hypothetical protein